MELPSLTSTELTGQYGLAILIIPTTMRTHSKVARDLDPKYINNGLQLKPVLHSVLQVQFFTFKTALYSTYFTERERI